MMKKTLSKTDRAIKTILEDEEMEECFRKLVEKADSKGLCLANFQSAAKFFWNKYSSKKLPEQEEIVFTAEEEDFFNKVDLFWQKFGKNIMTYFLRTREKDKFSRSFYKKPIFYTMLFKIMYLVFEKENSVTINLIEKYEKKYFHTSLISLDKTVSRDLYHLFRLCFYFSTDTNGKSYPMFFLEDWETHNKDVSLIYEHPDFEKFYNQYKTIYRSFSEVALFEIWFIKKFF